MIVRLIVLILVLSCGFGATALIPDSPPTRKAGIKMELPRRLKGWTGEPLEPSKEELALLAADTEFEKKTYHKFRGSIGVGALEGVHVSIVLSGSDVNNSIHRPERCMPSQGFENLRISRLQVPTSKGDFTARRIRASRTHTLSGEVGDSVTMDSIIYYWFVGASSVTDSHYGRTFIDMRERVLKGYDQRWAYITVSGVITDSLDPVLGRSEEETDRVVAEFAQKVFEECVEVDIEEQ